MIAFIQAVHDKLTTDPLLPEILGEPLRLYLEIAPQDEPLPYAVQRLAVELDESEAVLEGSLLLDIWWNGFSAAPALAAGIQIKTLLHNSTDPTLYHAGLQFRGMGTVETDNEEVKRVAMRFRADIPDLDLALAAG